MPLGLGATTAPTAAAAAAVAKIINFRASCFRELFSVCYVYMFFFLAVVVVVVVVVVAAAAAAAVGRKDGLCCWR